MSVLFIGDGTLTSSKAFTTVTLTKNPTLSTAGIPIVQNLDVITSDASFRTVYKLGEMQMPQQLRFNLLSNLEQETLAEWVKTLEGGSNWFTLQNQYVAIKPAMTVQGGNASTIIASTPGAGLVSADWPVRPVGQWVIFLTGALAGKRRRIASYSSALSAVVVDPAFSVTPAAGVDTFVIGLPVFLVGNPRFDPQGAVFWTVEFDFQEIGGHN